MKRIAFHTLGCKVNFCDTEDIRRQFTGSGYSVVPEFAQADICIINTCTVTDRSDAKCRQVVRKAVKSAPGAVIIVTGCMAQTQPDAVLKIPGVDYVIGNPDKDRIIEIIQNSVKSGSVDASETRHPGISGMQSSGKAGQRTRAFHKIQDGCSFHCSYCIIPEARGSSRSVPADKVLKEVSGLTAAGFKEIVLTGINLGHYRDGGIRLSGLLNQMIRINNLPRIRLSSVEPDLITDELIELVVSSENICSHFHIPLQYGENSLLKAMNRHYTAEEYEEVISAITGKLPGCGLGTDVIVGFPGETEESFERTRELIERLPFTYLHVFPFSARKGTPAAGMKNRPHSAVVKARAGLLKETGRKKKQDFIRSKAGETVNILIETEKSNGLFEGTSDEYIRCRIRGDYRLNTIIESVVRKEKDLKADCTVIGDSPEEA